MFLKRVNKEALATTRAEFVDQVDTFLERNGFPNDDLHRRMFAMHVQSLPQEQDWFEPELVAASIRKAKANEQAFYVIYPEKAPKDEQVEGADSALEPKTEG